MSTAAFLLLFLIAAPAVASPQDDADAAISRGIQLRRQGDDAAALEEFQRAKKLAPSPRATAQVGLALQALGRWAEAEGELEDAMGNTQDSWISSHRTTLGSALGTVKDHVGSVEVLGSPPGAEVVVEQRRAGVLPLSKPVRATAGTVSLEVHAVGYLPVTRNVSVTPGTLSRETVRLTPDPAASHPASVHPASVNSVSVSAEPAADSAEVADAAPDNNPGLGWHGPAAWATGIGSAVLLAGGITALVIRSDKSEQLAHRIDVDRTCARSGNVFSGNEAAACADLAGAKETWTWVAVGTLVGAGLAAITTVVLVATRPSQAQAQASTATAVPRIAAAMDPKGALLSARWQF